VNVQVMGYPYRSNRICWLRTMAIGLHACGQPIGTPDAP
jgi:hypothetical protein